MGCAADAPRQLDQAVNGVDTATKRETPVSTRFCAIRVTYFCLAHEWPFTPCSAAFSNLSRSTFLSPPLPRRDGIMGEEVPVGLLLSFSRASSSASEKFLRCFGRKGTGVDTLEVKNWILLACGLARDHCGSTYRRRGAQQRNQRRLYHVFVDTNTPDFFM